MPLGVLPSEGGYSQEGLELVNYNSIDIARVTALKRFLITETLNKLHLVYIRSGFLRRSNGQSQWISILPTNACFNGQETLSKSTSMFLNGLHWTISTARERFSAAVFTLACLALKQISVRSEWRRLLTACRLKHNERPSWSPEEEWTLPRDVRVATTISF